MIKGADSLRRVLLRSILSALVVLLVMVFAWAGHNTSPQAATPTPTPPFVAAPASIAGWTSTLADYWCGYVFQQNDITGIRAQWIEPDVQGDDSTLEYTWIGIDGWFLDTLVQAGTQGQPYDTYSVHQIWYEMYNAAWGNAGNAPSLPGQPASAGDHIVASIQLAHQHPDQWDVLVVDSTRQTGYHNILPAGFDTPRRTADFIIEAPTYSKYPGVTFALPQFTPITFSNMQIRVGDKWVSAASLPAQQVDMVQSGTTLATAGPLAANSSFTITKAP